MKLVIGGDHAGYPLKVKVLARLKAQGHDVTDVGAFSEEPVDFPDVTARLVAKLRDGTAERGLLVCGTGVGAAIAANKFRGVRAALCHDIHSAHQCVEHDDANVMCLGGWIVGEQVAYELHRRVPERAPQQRGAVPPPRREAERDRGGRVGLRGRTRRSS